MDLAFLYGVTECFPAQARKLAELDGVKPLVLGDGVVKIVQPFLNAIHCLDEMEQ